MSFEFLRFNLPSAAEIITALTSATIFEGNTWIKSQKDFKLWPSGNYSM